MFLKKKYSGDYITRVNKRLSHCLEYILRQPYKIEIDGMADLYFNAIPNLWDVDFSKSRKNIRHQWRV